jgi:hypothetical protein
MSASAYNPLLLAATIVILALAALLACLSRRGARRWWIQSEHFAPNEPDKKMPRCHLSFEYLSCRSRILPLLNFVLS